MRDKTYERIKEYNEFNKKFLDTLNLDKYINKSHDVMEIIDMIEDDYDDSNLLPKELGGCVFNFLNTEEIAEYFANRYKMKWIETIIYKYTLYK